MTRVADAGFRAVAIDLRGYGASDKPPRGYDGYTMAADVTGLIRALGERSAMIVGAGAGGMIGWAAAAFHPKLVSRLVVLGAAHPLRLRAAIFADPRGQLAASSTVLRFQVPRYEHVLTRDNAALVGELMTRWAGPQWTKTPEFEDYVVRCREAMQIPQAAFCALETYRWAVRSALRLQGYRFVKLLQQPVTAPTLQLHGALDPAVLPRTAQGSGRYVLAEYEWRLLPNVAHFPHLEQPDVVTGEILRWAKAG
jgi:pimeloyl-ACP methyl ester carboxylesterase